MNFRSLFPRKSSLPLVEEGMNRRNFMVLASVGATSLVAAPSVEILKDGIPTGQFMGSGGEFIDPTLRDEVRSWEAARWRALLEMRTDANWAPLCSRLRDLSRGEDGIRVVSEDFTYSINWEKESPEALTIGGSRATRFREVSDRRAFLMYEALGAERGLVGVRLRKAEDELQGKIGSFLEGAPEHPRGSMVRLDINGRQYYMENRNNPRYWWKHHWPEPEVVAYLV
jgi:hypothetical protein